MFYLGTDIRDTKNRAMIWVLSLIFVMGGLFVAFSDTLTTSMWYDSLGLKPVLDSFTMVSWITDSFGVSAEGALVGIMTFAVQIYCSYKIALAALDNKGKFSLNNSSYQPYINWWIARIVFAAFDTYTDTTYRANDGNLFSSLLVSLFLYNAFSEFAIGTGIRELVTNVDAGLSFFGEVWANLIFAWRSVNKMMSQARSGQKPAQMDNHYRGGGGGGGGKPQGNFGPPPPVQNQGGSGHRHQPQPQKASKPNGGFPGNPPAGKTPGPSGFRSPLPPIGPTPTFYNGKTADGRSMEDFEDDLPDFMRK